MRRGRYLFQEIAVIMETPIKTFRVLPSTVHQRMFMAALVCLLLPGCGTTAQGPPTPAGPVNSTIYFYAPPGGTYRLAVYSEGHLYDTNIPFVAYTTPYNVPFSDPSAPPVVLTPTVAGDSLYVASATLQGGHMYETELQFLNTWNRWARVDDVDRFGANELILVHP